MSKLTKRALAAALGELLRDKPLDRITIKDITDRCGLTRNAFYYHFSDVYELLGWMFVSMAEEILEDFDREEKWQEGFEKGILFLQENKSAVNHVYKYLSREHLENYLDKVVGCYALRILRVHTGGANENAERLVADFYKNAFIGVIMRWIENDMDMPAEKLAKICDTMFRGTVDAAVRSAIEVVDNL